jgi:DNA-binding MarR family transcriptional regulator
MRKSSNKVGKKVPEPSAPSPAVLAILARFRVIFQTNRRHYQNVQESIGLGGSQLQALAIIAAQPAVGISALAKAMLVRQPTASNLVEQLVRLGLVRRKKSGSDLRAVELTITPKARRVLARAPGPVVGILADAIGSLRPSAIVELRKALDGVLHAMKSRDEGARFKPLADM